MEEKVPKDLRNDVLSSAAHHHSQYLAYAFGILGDWSSAEDVVQEAYLRIADKWENFDQDKPIFPWARSFVRNACLEHRRARGKESTIGNEILEVLVESNLEDFFSSASAQERLDEKVRGLLQCFESLNGQSKRVLYSFYVQGKNCREIAKSEGVHEHTPINQLSRLRKQMRQCLLSRSDSEEEDGEQVCNLDEFFAQSNAEQVDAEIKAILNYCDGEGMPLIHYIEEYTVFAVALKKWMEASESVEEAEAARIRADNGFDESALHISSIDSRMATIPEEEHEKILSGSSSSQWHLTWIAALFCIGLGLWFFMATSGSEPIAQFVSVDGAVYLIKGDEKVSAAVGQSIAQGDRVYTKFANQCKITYLNEKKSVLELGADSELIFERDQNTRGKQLRLSHGTLLCAVARQKKDEPMKVLTPHAMIRVLGTRFQLTVTPVSTELSLYSGRLLFKDIINGTEHFLNSGESASIENGEFRMLQADPGKGNQVIPLEYDRNGLIALYRFDEGQGGVVSDSSSFGSVGKIGPSVDLNNVWVSGVSGTGIDFPTAGIPGEKYVRVIKVSRFPTDKIKNQLSVLMWIRPDFMGNAPNGAENTLVSSPATQLGAGWRYRIAYRDGLLQTSFRINFDGDEKSDYNLGNIVYSEQFYPSNKWMHIGVVFDSGYARFYVDGKASGLVRKLNDSFIKDVPHDNFYIGPFAQESILHYDDLAIYSRALPEKDFLLFQK